LSDKDAAEITVLFFVVVGLLGLVIQFSFREEETKSLPGIF